MSWSQKRFVASYHQRRRLAFLGLAGLSFLMLAVGIYLKHYFIVFAFGVWLCAETILLKLQTLIRSPRFNHRFLKKQKTFADDRSRIWELYEEGHENAFTLAGLKLTEWLGQSPEPEKKAWSSQFLVLSQLKILIDSKSELSGKRSLQQWFVFQPSQRNNWINSSNATLAPKTLDHIIEAAVTVSELLTQTQRIAENDAGRLGAEARKLIEKVLGFPFETIKSHAFIDRLVNAMQKDAGCPFLILNLMRANKSVLAREIGRQMLAGEIECEEDLKSTLYWLSEITWFSKEKKKEILNHDEAIKLLYHLCFVSPDRAGFLEIDSQFFSEFGSINEIAEEGFLFKEALVESLLELWEGYEGWFDGVFQNVLEHLTGRKSKIFDERQNWMRFWRSEKDQFSREYLYVVEGNLCFVSGAVEDAKFCYKKALEISPKLRAALFNILYVSAKLKDNSLHQWAINQIIDNEEWFPLGLSAIGNSFLLMGEYEKAKEYFDRLRSQKGWETKVDYYISMFSFENGLYDSALIHAKAAHDLNPLDSSINFHLSRCLSLAGQKEAALEAVNRVKIVGDNDLEYSNQPLWLKFYKFTLEKDSGRFEEASRTLLEIPIEYYDDEQELALAMDFAKSKKDLRLLRHLKSAIKNHED